MTLLLKVILSKPGMSKACQYDIRKMKENAFTLTKVEPLPFWLNIDKTQLQQVTKSSVIVQGKKIFKL